MTVVFENNMVRIKTLGDKKSPVNFGTISDTDGT